MSEYDTLDGVLSVGEYLSMVQALVVDETRFRVVHTVWTSDEEGSMIDDVADQLGESKDVVEGHIDTTVSAGLLERWERTERGSIEAEEYYQATVNADIILSDGVLELFADH